MTSTGNQGKRSVVHMLEIAIHSWLKVGEYRFITEIFPLKRFNFIRFADIPLNGHRTYLCPMAVSSDYESVWQQWRTRMHIRARLRTIEAELLPALRELPQREAASHEALRRLHRLEKKWLPSITASARRRRNERVRQRRASYIRCWEAERELARQIEGLLYEKDILLQKLDRDAWLEQLVLDHLDRRERDRAALHPDHLRQLDQLARQRADAEKRLREAQDGLARAADLDPLLQEALERTGQLLEDWNRQAPHPDYGSRRDDLGRLLPQCRKITTGMSRLLNLQTALQPSGHTAGINAAWPAAPDLPGLQPDYLRRIRQRLRRLDEVADLYRQALECAVESAQLDLQSAALQRRRILLNS